MFLFFCLFVLQEIGSEMHVSIEMICDGFDDYCTFHLVPSSQPSNLCNTSVYYQIIEKSHIHEPQLCFLLSANYLKVT